MSQPFPDQPTCERAKNGSRVNHQHSIRGEVLFRTRQDGVFFLPMVSSIISSIGSKLFILLSPPLHRGLNGSEDYGDSD